MRQLSTACADQGTPQGPDSAGPAKLRGGAGIDGGGSWGTTALRFAAVHNQVIAMALVDGRAVVAKACEKLGITALMNAAQYGSNEAVQCLLRRGRKHIFMKRQQS